MVPCPKFLPDSPRSAMDPSCGPLAVVHIVLMWTLTSSPTVAESPFSHKGCSPDHHEHLNMTATPTDTTTTIATTTDHDHGKFDKGTTTLATTAISHPHLLAVRLSPPTEPQGSEINASPHAITSTCLNPGAGGSATLCAAAAAGGSATLCAAVAGLLLCR